MGVLSKIFGSDKHVTKVLDGATKGMDKLFFTKEEKAEANQKLGEWYLKYLAATQPQNLARRWLALVVAILWASLILAGIGARAFGDVELSTYIFEVMNDLVHQPFMLIMGFYFLAHVVRTYQSSKEK